IPISGKVVIVANHPIGSLDGLALLKLVGEVRKDVKVVANEVLSALSPLDDLLLPVDNLGNATVRQNLKAIHGHLHNEGAVIIFPAGEVSRFGPQGIRDRRWNNSFVKIASRTRSPVLPVFVDGRNSVFFYVLSFLARPCSSLWLVHEMFKQSSQTLNIRIGNPVAYQNYASAGREFDHKAKLFRKHVYRLQHNRKLCFEDQEAVAHPEDRYLLRAEIKKCELLGETVDHKSIYLYRYCSDSAVMRELGRLRELSFRAVGEGTGLRRDTDVYDASYEHIVLWDDTELEIVGSYRVGDTRNILNEKGIAGLYSATLFKYNENMRAYLNAGLELGRSFVQLRYQGMRSLDYLWQGIGAYLRSKPEIRYLFGPVSISNDYPEKTKAALVCFYSLYFSSKQVCAEAINPYVPDESVLPAQLFKGLDFKEDFSLLRAFLEESGVVVPVLYKQYTEICEPEGVCIFGFNVDPGFSGCVDGLVLVDIEKLKPRKRKRYLSGE
ncbi:MAG: lysophospholipid acyltransferase family protein, partial [Pseudomonadales bacterium]|nr:lysophospholipid acyltransferase family protein [Pseudomonadales bacterium]